ncbi:MAG: S-layer family protein, partial [Cyanobacteria bacterium P01_F01_bin.13]
SMAEGGLIDLSNSENTFQLAAPAGLARADVLVTDGARVDVSDARGQGGGQGGRQNGRQGGGSIHIQGDTVTFEQEAQVDANTLGDQIDIGILIQASRVIVRGGAQLSANVAETGTGQGGGIQVFASEAVAVVGTSTSGQTENSGGGGSGGGNKPSKLASDAQGPGQAGDLIITTERVIVRDGGKISSSTSADNARGGDVIINASELVDVIGEGTANNQTRVSGISVQIRGEGEAGDVRIDTGRLTVQDGAEIIADTFSSSQGGSISIQATESLEVVGTSEDGQLASRIVAETGRARNFNDVGLLQGTGDGGSVIITAGELMVRDGALVSASGVSDGPEPGDAGDLRIVADTVRLDHQGMIAATTTSGDGGDIFLSVKDAILLRRQSQISTTAGTSESGGDGGNITVNAEFLVAAPDEDSNITANAFSGRGGSVRITATGIYGIEFQTAELPISNDITASSTFGTDGLVQLDTPEIDPGSDVATLPETVGTPKISQRCNGNEGSSNFVATGRGGTPTASGETVPGLLWESLAGPDGSMPRASIDLEQFDEADLAPLREAQGWVTNGLGQVVLTTVVTESVPVGTNLWSTVLCTATIEAPDIIRQLESRHFL